MGVIGLWRLIEPSGKPVPLETLENKTLAVDVSIWLHQAIKGFQDSQGAAIQNSHLLLIYHRVCKLLYFRIKPVFVFDGGVPNLKKETIVKRLQQKSRKLTEAESIQQKLLSTFLKHSAVNKVLADHAKANLPAKTVPPKASKSEDIYKLPPTESSLLSSDEESSNDLTTDTSAIKHWDLHTIDEKSPHFKSLPADVRHDILTELKETRKQSSWGRIHEMPKKSDAFSGFQMKRLLKRYSVQVSLEEAEKEMGGRSMSLAELETLLNEQGVVTSDSVGSRIASNEHKKYLLIKDVKKAMDDAKKEANSELSNTEDQDDTNMEKLNDDSSKGKLNKADIEFQSDLEAAIQLSLQDVPSTSSRVVNDFKPTTSNSHNVHKEKSSLSSAKNYMVEYSGLTPNEIAAIINSTEASGSLDDLNSLKTVSSVLTETAVSSTTKDDDDEAILLNTTDNIELEVTDRAKEADLSEEIPESSTREDVVTENSPEANLKEDNEAESDVISIADSSSSEDFLEVSADQEKCSSSGLEIVIKPENEIEDDIFKDVFSNENQDDVSLEKSVITSTESINVAEKTNTITMDQEMEASTSTYEIERDESLKQQKTAMIIKDLLKPLEDSDTNPGLSTEQLIQIQSNLQEEKTELLTERFSKERMASNLTEQMYQEAQELLQLFGIPYIVAPMEAEAQCAFLETINLTNGTITDDSDVWLFGGKTVYKNFFNQHKLVMEFRAENILHHFKLSREQMILLALLVGSDYTTGLQGIGPVTALEVLAAFPLSKTENIESELLLSGLMNFRKWISDGKTVGPGRTALRSKLQNVAIPESFPSLQVVKAYLEPTVDSSEESFSWSKPNISGLIEFARQKFGWTRTKSEEILKPVLKRQNDSRIQRSIKDYFQTKHKVDSGELENKMSKRVRKAVTKIGGGTVDTPEETTKAKRKTNKNKQRKKKNPVDDGASTSSVTPTEIPIIDDNTEPLSDEDFHILKQTFKQSKTKLEEIKSEIKHNLEQQQQEQQQKKPRAIANLHKKDVIPQKQKDKVDALRNKLKAIETFRRSKQGPGYIKKRRITKMQPKDDAELSESSSTD